MPGAGARETSSWAASSRLTAISRPRQLSVSIAAQSPIDLYGERRHTELDGACRFADFGTALSARASLAIVDDGLRYLL